MSCSKWKSYTARTVRTKLGHVITMEPKKVYELPDEIRDELLVAGCVPVDEDDDVSNEPGERVDRPEAIRTALEQLMVMGDEDAFTNSGYPRVNVVASIAGLEDLARAEVVDAWDAMQADAEE